MSKKVIYSISFIVFLLLYNFNSCTVGKGIQPEFHYSATELDNIEADSIAELLNNNPFDANLARKLWSYYTQSGQVDKLIRHASSIYRQSILNNDYKFAVTAASYMAHPYITINKPDSARFYLDFIKHHIDENDPLYGSYNNAEAEYAIKFEFDYPKAMSSLRKSLEYYKRKKNHANQAIILGNISSLYARRSDTTGLSYAREAYHLTDSINNPYARAIAISSLAQMEYLSGYMQEAMKHVNECKDSITKHPSLQLISSEIYTTAGNIHTALHDFHKADSCYREAFDNLNHNADENVHIKLYRSYGDFLYKTKNYTEAENYYKLGILTSEKSNNIDDMHHLLHGLSETYEALGMTDSALVYQKKYHQAATEAFNLYKEKEFNQLFLDYEKVKYEKDLQQKELEISDSRKVIIIISAVLAIAVILSISLIYVYRKKDRMYTILVEQHQQSLQQMKLKEKMAQENIRNRDDSKSQNEQELFNRLENLMKSEKIFRETDLTLDRIASLLDSNRTYVSSVINKYAGMTFPNYLNNYRIGEAISIISDPDRDIVLKALCNELGYKSMTSFYRAFQKETGCTPSVYREKVLKLKKEKQNTEDSAMAAE